MTEEDIQRSLLPQKLTTLSKRKTANSFSSLFVPEIPIGGEHMLCNKQSLCLCLCVLLIGTAALAQRITGSLSLVW
jgi:hypothetical protein